MPRRRPSGLAVAVGVLFATALLQVAWRVSSDRPMELRVVVGEPLPMEFTDLVGNPVDVSGWVLFVCTASCAACDRMVSDPSSALWAEGAARLVVLGGREVASAYAAGRGLPPARVLTVPPEELDDHRPRPRTLYLLATPTVVEVGADGLVRDVRIDQPRGGER